MTEMILPKWEVFLEVVGTPEDTEHGNWIFGVMAADTHLAVFPCTPTAHHYIEFVDYFIFFENDEAYNEKTVQEADDEKFAFMREDGFYFTISDWRELDTKPLPEPDACGMFEEYDNPDKHQHLVEWFTGVGGAGELFSRRECLNCIKHFWGG